MFVSPPSVHSCLPVLDIFVFLFSASRTLFAGHLASLVMDCHCFVSVVCIFTVFTVIEEISLLSIKDLRFFVLLLHPHFSQAILLVWLWTVTVCLRGMNLLSFYRDRKKLVVICEKTFVFFSVLDFIHTFRRPFI